ncbi:hypothetical protein PHMEG_000310 [Phytophthora megakarya]|uniref:Zinc finger PHD-type domain-containing protein n=1 Tax=Phytophthora megakarya TaxID=4795 RepID=A0A225X5S5_9STRA|nr:hypothetical protein PHMEG_000310 [Phytophthora megakarya]
MALKRSNMANESLSCPVCLEVFVTPGAAYALHVASCSSEAPSPPASPTSAHCPRCFHVYKAGTLVHEISFHEHECGRVNELAETDADASDASTGRKAKRPRHSAVERVAAPNVTLFPSSCFLCGNGGRGLLHCGGSCARAAHQNCVDQLQAPLRGEPLSVAEKKQAADQWKCAQCLRGLHRCQRCGFLGHENNAMRKCSVLDCGYHFHEQCVAESERGHAGFVCPRHTCATCGGEETDMRRCKSCSVCYHMTHLRCPRGSGAGQTTTNGGLDPTFLFVCPRHDEETTTSPTSSPDASNSLRLRLAAGDVVLVLEFNNALLPTSAKTAAPDAANHWGVVISAEETEPHGRGNQLLSVRMFADDNVLDVPNQYALRVATASDFTRPVDLIRHCLLRHAMVELQLRQMERNIADDEVQRILRASNAAFAARLKALNVTAAQAKSDAEEGLARWRRFQALSEPRTYDGLGDSAPSFIYIDTRGSRPGQSIFSSTSTSELVKADADGDVSMTDPDTDSGVVPSSGLILGSPHAKAPSRPGNAGKSPHEGEIQKPNDEAIADNEVPVVDTRFYDSNQAQSQTSTQDTFMGTQDTQQESDSQSWSQATSSSTMDITSVISSNDTNNNKRTVDVVAGDDTRKRQSVLVSSYILFNNGYHLIAGDDGSDAKRQKTKRDTVGLTTPAFTPTNFRGFPPGATVSSAPSTLHISPMGSTTRTMLPKKRKHLTRKQKLLADMPDMLLKQLERQASQYLEEADGSKTKPAQIPSDADAFPWAARATSFRPAFFRPTVMLGHSGLRRSGLYAISRLLVTQDKRSIKCYIQTFQEGADMSKCSHRIYLNKKASSSSPGFVLLDLLTLRNFRDLESVVRSRLVESLGKRSRYTRDQFGMDALQAQRWLELQHRKKASEQLAISLSYCAMDGVRRPIKLQDASLKPSPKEKKVWLCFCENVCHLSVAIAVPIVSHATSTSIAEPQQVPVLGTAK